MHEKWQFPTVETRRGYIGRKVKAHKILGAFVGFMMAASLTAMAAWIVVPHSTGTGFGKAKDATSGLALVTLDLQPADPIFDGQAIGPSEQGNIFARWQNNNNFNVSIVKFGAVDGTSITRVGDPTCVASPSTFTVTPSTAPVGSWVAANSGGTVMVGAQINTTASFPSCLAGGEFKLDVYADAQAGA
jgi:hypothetical protein